jgi:hypothetical protein
MRSILALASDGSAQANACGSASPMTLRRLRSGARWRFTAPPALREFGWFSAVHIGPEVHYNQTGVTRERV